jgi:hypothetical protein
MRYAQEKSGQKLHLVCEPGEEYRGEVIRAGRLSHPLCGRKAASYRMTINMPLAHACKNCVRVRNAGKWEKP